MAGTGLNGRDRAESPRSYPNREQPQVTGNQFKWNPTGALQPSAVSWFYPYHVLCAALLLQSVVYRTSSINARGSFLEMLNLRPHPGKLNQNPHFNKILGNSCVHSSLRSPALKHGEPNVRLYHHLWNNQVIGPPTYSPDPKRPSSLIFSTHILSVFICFEAKSQSAHPDHNPKPNSQGVKRRQ